MQARNTIVRGVCAALALAAGALALTSTAPRASAQSSAPASARHVNQVSVAARAAIEKYARLVYRPTSSGLRTATGTIALASDSDEAIARFTLTAQRAMRVEWTHAGTSKRHPQAMLGMIDMVLSAAFTGVPIPDESEYDAELVRDAAGDALEITTFRGEVARLKLRVPLDSNGLAKSLTMTPAAPESAARSMTTVLSWQKSGEKYRVTKLAFPDGGMGAPGEMSISLAYGEFAHLAIVTAWTVDAMLGSQVQSMGFRVATLELDGKPVELPKAAPGGATKR